MLCTDDTGRYGGGDMEGQLSLFSEEQKTSAKAKKTVEKKPVNLSQKFDERMKRFWQRDRRKER